MGYAKSEGRRGRNKGRGGSKGTGTLRIQGRGKEEMTMFAAKSTRTKPAHIKKNQPASKPSLTNFPKRFDIIRLIRK